MSNAAARQGSKAAAAGRAITAAAAASKIQAEYDKALKAFESSPNAEKAADVVSAWQKLKDNGVRIKLATSVVNFGNALRRRK